MTYPATTEVLSSGGEGKEVEGNESAAGDDGNREHGHVSHFRGHRPISQESNRLVRVFWWYIGACIVVSVEFRGNKTLVRPYESAGEGDIFMFIFIFRVVRCSQTQMMGQTFSEKHSPSVM